MDHSPRVPVVFHIVRIASAPRTRALSRHQTFIMPKPSAHSPTVPPDAIILAAGKGKRMTRESGAEGNSASPDAPRDKPLPKVLYPVAGKPMVWWVVKACQAAGVERCIVVIGYEGQQVRDALEGEANIHYVEQTEQLGTGHAARMAEPLFKGLPPRDVFVLAGDGPLIRADTLALLLETHRSAGAGSTLATAKLEDPTGYGRVLRSPAGDLIAIVEQKDATPEQLACREVNPSYYCFRSDLLFAALGRVKRNNAQGEYYLTDVPSMLKSEGHGVKVVDAVPPEDVHSVNNPEQLALVDRLMRERISESAATRI
ncbi:MAG: NTP transferase domain-containing protein [Phycisphaeraceae bacterium]